MGVLLEDLFACFQIGDDVDVFLHRLVAGFALDFGPGVIFGAVDHVHHAGTLAFHVAAGGLLVQLVHLQHGAVVRALGQGFGIGNGLFKRVFQAHDGSASKGDGVGSDCVKLGKLANSHADAYKNRHAE